MEYHSGGSLPLLGRPRYCPGANANGGYLCETGHCCGETGCCTYYYELWWFWLLWTVLILFSCCCAYRHRRAKLRVQQQQRQREISLLAYHGANSFTSSMLDLSFLASLKLPSYEEVAAQPSTPPPPYSSVFTTPRYPQPPRAADPHLLTQHGPLLHRPLSDGPSSFSSDNSSSCSCDSCCPSSPCSSSLSAPVTYETDTSHASTPSEATPLALDVTMETISAAARCLEAGASAAVDMEGAQEPLATDQTVTTATSPQPEVVLTIAALSPADVRPGAPPCSPAASAGSCSPLPSPRLDAETPDSSRTFDPPGGPLSPSAPPASPDVLRTTAFGGDAAGLPGQERRPSDCPISKPTHLNLAPGAIAATVSSPLSQNLDPSPGSGLVQIPLSPGSGPSQHAVPLLTVTGSGPTPSLRGPSDPSLLALSPSNVPADFGCGPGSPTLVPAITVEDETSLASSPSPLAVASPSLLDPLASLHPSDRNGGGGSSGHASSLSPSPRATQSPPKQTVFSPCVDVFEASSCWEDGEEEEGRDGGGREDDEDEDMGADESQRRRRRLTGDSGIEVCRCRVEEEEEEDEDDEHGEEEEEKAGDAGVHDSLDCPARSQVSAGDELTPCSASVATANLEEKVVVVMETV